MKKKEQLEPEKIVFPRLLQNTPTGEDWFEGQSQQKLAEAISGHILKNDAHTDKSQVVPRIIGIEGEWGSGKSNVVTLLKKNIKEKYHFYVYDAWGNQENLQKRSILEAITDDLTSGDKPLLTGTVKFWVNGEEKNESWKKRVDYLMAKRVETDSFRFPKLSAGFLTTMLYFILLLVIATAMAVGNTSLSSWAICLVDILLPAGICSIKVVLWDKCYKKRSISLDYFLAVFANKVEQTSTNETISEREPSQTDFRKWLQDVSDNLKNQKLVIVFDNMDRLPAEKVKSLWAIIHTFFAESGFDNVWVVVPYDKKHLSSAFGENEKKAKDLSQRFIEKTFPVVYRVAPAILTDQKKILDKLLLEAFGEKDASFDIINRIYRIQTPDGTVREMKLFVNDIVAMKQQWGDAISYLAMSLFSLHHDAIIENPEENILGDKIFSTYSRIIEKNDDLVNELASLMYGIDLPASRQMLIKKLVREALVEEKNTDLNAFVDKFSDYATLVIETVQDIDDAQLDKAIIRLNNLQLSEQNNETLWKGIFVRYIKLPIVNVEFTDTYKVLLLHVNENEQQRLVDKYMKGVAMLQDMRGDLYGKSLMAAEAYLKENYPKIQLNFIEKTMQSIDFLGFLSVVKKDYVKYNVLTNPEDLDMYVVELVDTDRSDQSSLQYLKGSEKYTLANLRKHLEASLAEADLDALKFERYNKAYLAITTEKPVGVKYNINAIVNIFNSYASLPSEVIVNSEGYLHSQAILIANNRTTPNLTIDQIKKVAAILPYYISWDQLINADITTPSAVYQPFICYAIRHKLATDMPIVEILRQFEAYCNRLTITGDELLNQLEVSAVTLKEWLTSNKISTIFTEPTLFVQWRDKDTEVCKIIHQQVVEELREVSSEDLMSTLPQFNTSYWHVVLAAYCGSQYLPALPENNVESFVKSWWLDKAKKFVVANSNEYMLRLLQYLKPDKLSREAREVRNEYCNQKSTINPQFFKHVAPYLLRESILDSRYADVATCIVLPTISNEALLPIWFSKVKLLRNIIDNAGETGNILVNKLRELKKSNTSVEYDDFYAGLDIPEVVEDEVDDEEE